MKNTRDIVVKALLNADEFLAFDAACKAADVKHSTKLRDLANRFSDQHDRRRNASREWPSAGHIRSMFLPGRSRGAGRSMSMRM